MIVYDDDEHEKGVLESDQALQVYASTLTDHQIETRMRQSRAHATRLEEETAVLRGVQWKREKARVASELARQALIDRLKEPVDSSKGDAMEV